MFSGANLAQKSRSLSFFGSASEAGVGGGSGSVFGGGVAIVGCGGNMTMGNSLELSSPIGSVATVDAIAEDVGIPAEGPGSIADVCTIGCGLPVFARGG